MKLCQWDKGCECEPLAKEKYCRTHRRMMIRRMEDDGYLEPLPVKTEKRRRSAREDATETKFGNDS